MNNPAQDDLTPLHYAARYTPKGTAEMETGMTEEIVPLPPTKVRLATHVLVNELCSQRGLQTEELPIHSISMSSTLSSPHLL